ncbi:MAG: penicillin-binding protein 2 [Parcubacteria group bacterium Greene0714_21]|nr:MAG: penicillin-binding protein 2 [Parcubacteria group bacterium Greene0416_39]TSD03886.1 MAG: penicillin-binding protein 2 [Parcubacteria group bacterium Greene0714_21]
MHLFVKTGATELEPQEVLLDRLATIANVGLEGQRLEVPLPLHTLRGLYVLFLVVGAVFLVKSFQLQVVEGSKLSLLAYQNTFREISVLANRGVIYDRDFVQLVANSPSFDLVCDKREMPLGTAGKEAVVKKVSELSKEDFEELKKAFNESPESQALLLADVPHETLVVLAANKGEFGGCEIQENARRAYLKGDAFSHLLGYTAKVSKEELETLGGYSFADQIGKQGVEKFYEPFLRGTPGKRILQKDASGAVVGEVKEFAPKDAKNAVLFADSGLQEAIVRELREVFYQTGTKKAAAVALDPQTGGILALVSLPSFNANAFSGGLSSKEWQALLKNPLHPLFNRAISGIGFPTGSVIKPLMGVAALQEGVITKDTVLFAPLELCVPNIFTKQDECFADWKFHGNSDLKRAIAESVNPFFYIIGGGYERFQGLGPERIKKYLELFGWGKPTGIDLPGEGSGILPTIDKNWRLGDTYHFSIGQGPFAITPLQVALAIGAIANKGKLMEPHVVEKITDSNKRVLETFKPKVMRENFVSAENLELIREGMRQTVTAGSATGWLDHLPVKAAAKTGTAQTGRKTLDGKDFVYSWTAAFAPYENPSIVIVVVVEDVREGQVATLPVVKGALEWYFNKTNTAD